MEVINASQVDAWTEAAKAKGGIQRVWVRPQRVSLVDDIKEVARKKYGEDIRWPTKEDLANATHITFDDTVRPAKEPASTTAPSRVDQYEGRTFVENEDMNSGILLEYVDPSVFEGSSLWASKAANRGAALHTFFYQETNFLEDAAKEYAVLGDNEMFRYRNIDDGDFIQQTLDFFTGGKYTDKDRKELEYQMENVVMELSRMVRNGEEADVSKVKSKLTVAGVEVSVAELMEYQKMGQKVVSSFLGADLGTLDSSKIAQAAQVGIAKAMGNLYGSERGELGKLFSDGVDRLYEKAVTNREKSAESSRKNWHSSPGLDEALDLEVDLARLFAKMDASSRESLTKSFQDTLNRAKSAVLGYCYKYGGSYLYNPYGNMINLNKAADQAQSFFQSWMDRIAQGA